MITQICRCFKRNYIQVFLDQKRDTIPHGKTRTRLKMATLISNITHRFTCHGWECGVDHGNHNIPRDDLQSLQKGSQKIYFKALPLVTASLWLKQQL